MSWDDYGKNKQTCFKQNDNGNNGRYFITIKHQIWGKVLQLYMHKKTRVPVHEKKHQQN